MVSKGKDGAGNDDKKTKVSWRNHGTICCREAGREAMLYIRINFVYDARERWPLRCGCWKLVCSDAHVKLSGGPPWHSCRRGPQQVNALAPLVAVTLA